MAILHRSLTSALTAPGFSDTPKGQTSCSLTIAAPQRPFQPPAFSTKSQKARCCAPAAAIRREVLSPSERSKLNRDDDRVWYGMPRMVQHSDDSFRANVTQLYRERIPEGATVLDLCSSWVSHLPPEKTYAKVVGHGMNAVELGRNERLSQFFVRDLNKDPDGWALADASFDAVLICCSVQYMQQPEKVLVEVQRVLKPGGACIVTFTNRLFYEKAVAAWRDGSMYARTLLVKNYFLAVDGFVEPEALTDMDMKQTAAARSGLEGMMQAMQRALAGGRQDPFHAVIAYKSTA